MALSFARPSPHIISFCKPFRRHRGIVEMLAVLLRLLLLTATTNAETMNRAQSLIFAERAFYNAAADSLSDHAHDDDDADILSDNERMVRVARDFLTKTAPEVIESLDQHADQKSSSDIVDRYVKIGRNIIATIAYADAIADREEEDPIARSAKTDASFARLVDECKTLAAILSGTETRRVPTVRFGKTEIAMPILSLGCMRFQQSWNRPKPVVQSIDDVDEECQDNLVRIIRYAHQMGVNHIETALGYGCSELQIGAALKTLCEAGEIKREDLIIQTKGGISSSTTKEQFRATILDQLDRLGLDYVDLFSVHGANTQNHWHWLYENPSGENLIDVLRELKRDGKIRFYGFSTHAPASVIRKLILEGDFDYLNLHHHFCGDYTATGDGETAGNLENVRLASEKMDMGVFIISPYDKGGRLYAPSNLLRDLTLPDFEPIEYASMWLWHHGRLHEDKSQPHTIVCGAARPSDLDQGIIAALNSQSPEAIKSIDAVASRLKRAMTKSLGDDFAKTWHVGLPNFSDAVQGTQMGNIVWLHNLIKSFGMLDFARDRYGTLTRNLAKWDYSKSKDESIQSIGPGWGWMPGTAFDPARDYSKDLTNVPAENLQEVQEAMAFVHRWCQKKENNSNASETQEEEEVPIDWQTAYDMRPWTAFPERG